MDDQDSVTPPARTRSYLALGSNVGDRHTMLLAAIEAIRESELVAAVSPFYETPAMMPEDAPASWDMPFLNAVVAIDTALAPVALLAKVKSIELDLGRAPTKRWAPRIIDIDILAYGDSVIETDDLTVPHGEAHKRLFVLEPWADIAPDYRHPLLSRTVEELLKQLQSS